MASSRIRTTSSGVTLHAGIASVDIAPNGTVRQIVLPLRGAATPLLISEQKPTKWFRGAKLSPFPNRIRDGKYSFAGQKRTLPINFPSQRHAIHGLMAKARMKTVGREVSKKGCAITLSHTFGNDPGYPFKVEIRIRYALENNRFVCETTLTNKGKKSAPIGDGWHPYFAFPADTTKLQLPRARRVELDDRMIPTGKTKPDARFARSRALRGLELDDCFAVPKGSTALLTGANFSIDICWRNYPFLQAFIPPGRKSVAIEPMTCAPDAFNNGQGLIILESDQIWKGGYSLGIR
jgi:aldose 1-epimerase